MPTNKKVILIGGSGFLGRKICEELVLQGFDLYCVKHESEFQTSSSINIIQGGIKALSSELIDSINPVFIIHSARPTLPKLRKLGRILATKKAKNLNKNLLNQLKNSSSKPKLIFASGTLSYGNNENPAFENSPISPLSYARQYIKGEFPIINNCKSEDYPIIILRLPWLLDKGSWFDWFYLQNIRKFGTIPLFGNGDNKMAIIDIADAVKLILKYASQKDLHGIYNIFSPNILTQLEFANAVKKTFGSRVLSYEKIYTDKLEIEALEAFTSNIIPATNYMDIISKYDFISLQESLEKLKTS